MWVKLLLEVHEENGRTTCEGRKQIGENYIVVFAILLVHPSMNAYVNGRFNL
jgi:hypothetical protein